MSANALSIFVIIAVLNILTLASDAKKEVKLVSVVRMNLINYILNFSVSLDI